MSQVYIYVLADDGKLYQDPVLYGDDWFLCFDDDEPPELVIQFKSRSQIQCRERALSILAETGIDAKVISKKPYDTSQRVFPPYDKSGNGRLRGAASFEIEVLQPIPAECLMQNDGNISLQEFADSPHESVMHLFGRELPDKRTSD